MISLFSLLILILYQYRYKGYLERNNYYDVKRKDHQFLCKNYQHLITS